MMKRLLVLAAVLLLAWGLYLAYPWLLWQVMNLQRDFNLQMSNALGALNRHSQKAGFTLIGISFLYGVFHALGPGHGKFILAGYMSVERTRLRPAIQMTLLSSMVQGLVAIALVSVIVVVLTLSKRYFNLTLSWVERLSFLAMIFVGCYWVWRAWQALRQAKAQAKNKPKIAQLRPVNHAFTLRPHSHEHCENCGCGHQHLPSAQQLTQRDWKAKAMIILSIGARPCSGAVFMLFLAYTVDLYLWGVFSALAMALGTGLTLSVFVWFVLTMKTQAVKLLGKSAKKTAHWGLYAKLALGAVLIGFGLLLLQSSLINDPAAGLLFRR